MHASWKHSITKLQSSNNAHQETRKRVTHCETLPELCVLCVECTNRCEISSNFGRIESFPGESGSNADEQQTISQRALRRAGRTLDNVEAHQCSSIIPHQHHQPTPEPILVTQISTSATNPRIHPATYGPRAGQLGRLSPPPPAGDHRVKFPPKQRERIQGP